MTPVQISGLSGVAAVAAGAAHSLALKTDGTLWVWGANTSGQLGVGDSSGTNRTTPVQILTLSGIVAVSTRANHTLALKSDGTVVAWGANGNGQLGNGGTTTQNAPVAVSSLTGVSAISAGDFHSLALKTDGSAFGWGSSGSGQVGNGSFSSQITGPVAVSNLGAVVTIAAGGRHSLALRADGTALAWGANLRGQLSDTTTYGSQSALPVSLSGTGNITTLAAGYDHTLAVTTDGVVWASGLNSTAQIGDGTLVNRPLLVKVSEAGYVWKVGTPTFSIASGTYTAVQNVVVASATAGATIHYTVNGALPTEADPVVPGNGIVSVTESLTLRAKAWKSGIPESNADSVTYVLRVPTPTLSPGTGTYAQPQTVTVTSSVSGVTLRYTTNGADPTTSDPVIASGGVASRAINGSANTVTWAFDTLGRLESEGNVLGTFTYSYDGATGRLASVIYPNGQRTLYSYFGNAGDHRLQTIHHQYPNATTLSKFDYTYDVVGNILTWRQQADATAVQWEYGYDPADQLVAAVKKSTDPTPAILQRYVYTYDPAGNRTSEQIADQVTGASYDTLNRLVSQQPAGAMQFAGTLNEPATVTIQNTPATVAASNAFSASVPVAARTSTVNVTATDPNGNTASHIYEVTSQGADKTFTYDANGNLTADGTRTFEWDARNQLVAVDVGNRRSEFTRDGFGRSVRQREKLSGVTQSDRFAIWCELRACEDRDAANGSVVHRLFGQGEVTLAQASLFVSDHLGSVAAFTDATGVVAGRQSYDPWGRLENQGNALIEMGYTSHRWHDEAYLWLTLYRAYDPTLGRWLSEDPLRETADTPNMYSYVRDNPIALVDPFGLASAPAGAGGLQSWFHACDFNYYRNDLNQCPQREPKKDPNWNQDSWVLAQAQRLIGGDGTRKYRHPQGYECAYDQCGNLKQDHGTYNYESRWWHPSHTINDVLPHLLCAGWYRKHATKTSR